MAAVAGWAAGGHIIPAGVALALFVFVATRRGPWSVIAAAVAPILAMASIHAPHLLDVRLVLWVATAWLAWIPLFVRLGGRVPWAAWILPATVVLMMPVLLGPWSLSLVASDIGPRAQVLLIVSLGVLLTSIGQFLDARVSQP